MGTSSQDGDSKPSSRTSSSEYPAPASEISDTGERELDVVMAEMVKRLSYPTCGASADFLIGRVKVQILQDKKQHNSGRLVQ